MNITPGPSILAYAETFAVPVAEVVEWVSTYINTYPAAWESDPTEKERAASIRAYMEKEVVDWVEAVYGKKG